MIEDVFVINPVAHAYNLRQDNIRPNVYARALADHLWDVHAKWNPPELQVPRDVYMSDWPVEALAKTLFLETEVDMAASMCLRLDSWFHDGLVSREKNAEIAKRWPGRFLSYVGVDPMAGREACLRDLADQMAEIPHATGLKLYPHRVEPYSYWRMDDPEVAFPLFERAQELGIRTVAVHKALAMGPVPIAPYAVDDIDGAAVQFPELSFEIIHSGMAFVDETAHAIGRFPNVYANLEVTSLFLHRAPGLFQEILAAFLFWGGPEKVIYSDGTLLCHSQPLIQKFWDLELPQEILDKYGMAQLSRSDKALMLGRNYARIVGVDTDQARTALLGDEFGLAQAARGLDPPYSNWMAIARQEGLVK